MADTPGQVRADGAVPNPGAASNQEKMPVDGPKLPPVPRAEGSPSETDKATPTEVAPSESGTSPSAESMQVGSDTPSTVDWDSDQNPYKYAAAQSTQILTQLQQAMIVNQLQNEATQLRDSGASEEQVSQHLNMRAREIQMAQQAQQLQSVARVQVADTFQQQLAAAGVTVTRDELLKDARGNDIQSPEAMEARAQALFEERRKGALQKRQESGTDKVGPDTPRPQVEGPARKMTPLQRIAAGLTQQRGG